MPVWLPFHLATIFIRLSSYLFGHYFIWLLFYLATISVWLLLCLFSYHVCLATTLIQLLFL